ncbi:unnamed protein product [Moneuplotes crassus]|uniref:Uncharacterized protein n=1 Tax=Euplotes crassus TaxID=5936 RepID=A0AAD1UGW5_EUPCR|nr:unnamed protein product [Moneuplotes crassus]
MNNYVIQGKKSRIESMTFYRLKRKKKFKLNTKINQSYNQSEASSSERKNHHRTVRNACSRKNRKNLWMIRSRDRPPRMSPKLKNSLKTKNQDLINVLEDGDLSCMDTKVGLRKNLVYNSPEQVKTDAPSRIDKSFMASQKKSQKRLLNCSKAKITNDSNIQQSFDNDKRVVSYSKIADFGNYNKFLKMYKNKIDWKVQFKKRLLDSSTLQRLNHQKGIKIKSPPRKFNLNFLDLKRLRKRSVERLNQNNKSILLQNQCSQFQQETRYTELCVSGKRPKTRFLSQSNYRTLDKTSYHPKTDRKAHPKSTSTSIITHCPASTNFRKDRSLGSRPKPPSTTFVRPKPVLAEHRDLYKFVE